MSEKEDKQERRKGAEKRHGCNPLWDGKKIKIKQEGNQDTLVKEQHNPGRLEAEW